MACSHRSWLFGNDIPPIPVMMFWLRRLLSTLAKKYIYIYIYTIICLPCMALCRACPALFISLLSDTILYKWSRRGLLDVYILANRRTRLKYRPSNSGRAEDQDQQGIFRQNQKEQSLNKLNHLLPDLRTAVTVCHKNENIDPVLRAKGSDGAF